MKKVVLACVIAGAMSVTSAFALSTVKFTDGAGTTGGGEFKADVGVNGSVDFKTFCLEYNEHISYDTTYYFGVSQAAKYQGLSANSPGSLDPLSRATAWLYLQFLNGTLSGINTAGNSILAGLYAGDNEDADHLQRAIWYLENESQGVNNAYAQLALATAGSGDNNGFYGVGVMNLWANPDGTGARQDQLIRVPDGGTTLVFLGMAMTGLAAAHRRSRKS